MIKRTFTTEELKSIKNANAFEYLIKDALKKGNNLQISKETLKELDRLSNYYGLALDLLGIYYRNEHKFTVVEE